MHPLMEHPEFCGIDGTEEKEPKSFGKLGKAYRSLAYTGLLHTILLSSRASKRMFPTAAAQIVSSHRMFFELALIRTVSQLAAELQRHVRPTFERRKENGPRIRGKIHFEQTIKKNYGLAHKHVCSFPELNFNDPLLCFIKKLGAILPGWLPEFVGEIRDSSLKSELSTIAYLLRDTIPVDDHLEIASQLVNYNLKYNAKYVALEPLARILAIFALSRATGLEKTDGNNSNEKLNVPGILLNLNYPFQDLIGLALKSATGNKYEPDTRDFNEITYKNKPRANNRMNPDCRGSFLKEKRESYLICDAKHKIMLPGEPILFDTADSDDLIPDSGRDRYVAIKKPDFYQIISYAMTHANFRERHCFYALCGLNEEGEKPSIEVVQHLDTISIEYAGKALKIVCLGVNFGTLLYRMGDVLVNGGKLEAVLSSFGTSLLKCLPDDAAVSHEMQKAA
jgi:hypothetical protein